MVKDLGKDLGKDFRILCGHEDDRREYTLQEQGKLPSHIRVWFIKTSGQLLFEEGKPKKTF